MTNLRKPPFWATTLTIMGISILGTLGTWQLHRLEWKEDLLTRINEQDQTPLAPLSAADLTPENEFLKGRLNGQYAFEKEIAVQPRTNEGTPGVHVITPYILNDGNTVLINRGWAPLGYDLKTPAARSSIDVIIRKPAKPNIFVPKNTPEKDQWYALDIDAIAATKNIANPLPVLGYVLNDTDAENTSYPDATALKIHINNNHLQYAFFWYAMAIVMLIVYGIRFIKPVKKTA